jgi:hypothetical protein
MNEILLLTFGECLPCTSTSHPTLTSSLKLRLVDKGFGLPAA